MNCVKNSDKKNKSIIRLKLFNLSLYTSPSSPSTYKQLLISGMAQLDVQRSGRIGFRALTYYSITTILAAIVGIAMVLMIHPGNPQIKTSAAAVVKAEETKVSTVDAILDIIRYGKSASNSTVTI